MSDTLIKDAKSRMTKGIESLKNNMAKIRTGRANASLLDSVMVSCYGTDTPMNQVATVSAIDARTLSVTPWDKSLLASVEKAIHTSDLGLNPAPYEGVIRVPIPQLTEERRKSLVKIIKEEAEHSRVGIRQVRREANQSVKQMVKDKALNDDEGKHLEHSIQQLTDKFIVEIDNLVKQKEQDIMAV